MTTGDRNFHRSQITELSCQPETGDPQAALCSDLGAKLIPLTQLALHATRTDAQHPTDPSSEFPGRLGKKKEVEQVFFFLVLLNGQT